MLSRLVHLPKTKDWAQQRSRVHYVARITGAAVAFTLWVCRVWIASFRIQAPNSTHSMPVQWLRGVKKRWGQQRQHLKIYSVTSRNCLLRSLSADLSSAPVSKLKDNHRASLFLNVWSRASIFSWPMPALPPGQL